MVAFKYERCVRFKDGLRDNMRVLIALRRECKFAVLVEKMKIIEDVIRVERHNRDCERDKNKKDSEPFSSVSRLKKKVRFDGLIRVGIPVSPKGMQPCSDYGRHHPGEWWRRLGTCLRCGSLEYRIRECLQWRVPGRGASQTEVKQLALVYTARRREDRDAPNVITDIRSTHLYIASLISKTLGIFVESISSEVTVLSPLGQSVQGSTLYKDVLLEVQEEIFLANLMELLFEEFDLILVWKGCEAYLAYVGVFDSRGSFVGDIRTVRDFLDVFSEGLPGLPLNREVEFGVEFLSGTTPVSIAPYRMALKKLTMLKAQLQELLDHGFICPSVSPLIWDHLKVASDRQKSYADLKMRDIEYSIGDFIFLKVAYQLNLPPELGRIHNVFYVSMLRRYRSDPSRVVSVGEIEVRPDLTIEDEPIQVLDRDVKILRRKFIPLVKVL
ncbi:uncharacterized protein [Gossypium hirsutum]|uniref:Tf2-1-like SH3-like domain-containing protein n=1 Tax=Gossypium hirsutum TaxID=3635 RepID=A0A1U8P8W6_GOSHI|nr:uncharacterized protein LOC107956417 [Gossypium hirsutum]